MSALKKEVDESINLSYHGPCHSEMVYLICSSSSLHSLIVSFSLCEIYSIVLFPSSFLHLPQVLPWILQTHCCLFLDKSPDQQCSPWSPSRDFNEDSSLSPPRNMKGLSGGRVPHQIPTLAPCGLAECEHLHDLHGMHVSDLRHSYLLSPTETCVMDFHHRLSPRSSIHSDCMIMSPMVLPSTAPADHISSSTFPRMHYSSQYYDPAAREDCAAITTSATSAAAAAATSASHHGSSKSNRIPANLLDQFEKQLPLHRDGFHTLQYQRTSAGTGGEQRSESPGRIRHLVHSVQKLFTKSHSLEGSSKMNGTKGDSGGGGSHHHHHGNHHSSKHGSKRSKSKERRHRSGTGGWWSSDDNLDSDSTYRTASALSRHHYEHVGHSFPESMHTHFGDHSLKTSKSNNDVKCSACESMAPEGKFMKRSSWSTLTVSQAKEAYRKSSLNLEKPMMHQDFKPSFRSTHYLQVPQDEWGGYPGIEKEEEIPCRRMRSSSYVKAMGDDDSGESDTSPKTSPQKTVRSDALVLKSALQRPHIDTQSSGYHLQTARDMRPHPSVSLDPSTNFNPPQFRSRNQSYMRAVSTFSQASCVSQVSETEVNGQFESVCESVFSEVESQAVEALDLPGSFRTRSHSYLRAIQAGYSQDDDCLPSMTSSTVTSTLRSTTEGYDAMEGTSLLNEDLIEDDDGASSSAYQEIERFERENAARSQHSTSSTVTAISVPPTSSHAYRVPCPPPSQPPPDPPVPQAIQAFKESANMVAAFNMQWKEEISAMRYELAELRRDVCGELKTFNSNFFNFTQCYNMWTMCREAATGTSSTQLSERVSVGVQTGANGLVRQNTADASVMCQPEPAAFNIFDLMEPPRIEITEGTPEGTTATNSPTSPASPDRPTTGPPLTKSLGRSKLDTGRKKKNCSRADGQRSASLELWCRKYTSGPMSYLSLSF
ncbi:discs, large (Drosophila) homolog-associated protein 2b [Pseudorasbora parva]|uniref:discs, large (Drosophila) homolog-associated protein 2b n=1 Tax=Pseudorasbora parva TaxID=51549 RepID=UPI00351DF91A